MIGFFRVLPIAVACSASAMQPMRHPCGKLVYARYADSLFLDPVFERRQCRYLDPDQSLRHARLLRRAPTERASIRLATNTRSPMTA